MCVRAGLAALCGAQLVAALSPAVPRSNLDLHAKVIASKDLGQNTDGQAPFGWVNPGSASWPSPQGLMPTNPFGGNPWMPAASVPASPVNEEPKLEPKLEEQMSVHGSGENPWCHNGHLLPNVFMLGMQKAGSSSIWKNLIDYLPLKRGCGEFGKGGECEVWGQKEPLYMKKELHYFDDDERYGKGLDFYSAHFPECTELKKSDRGLDGTPNYLNERVAQRMAESYGNRSKDLKFLLIIRDPVQRMEAGYWHFMPGHAGGFKEFVNKTLHGAKDWRDGKGESPWEPNPYHGSLYARALKQFMKYFDGSQFTVLTLEQYAEDPDRVMSFLAERLQQKKKKTIFKAEHRHERAHDKMDQETRQVLNEYFKDDQKEFNDLVKKHCMAMDCGSAESHM